MFLNNFCSLINQGYPIDEALNICYQIFHIDCIQNILNLLSKGESIEDALLKVSLPKTFQNYFYFFKSKNCLCDAIEKSLNICLKEQGYIKYLKRQLFYPGVLMIFVFFFSLFIIFVLMPNVQKLFDSFSMQPHLFTRILFYLYSSLPLVIVLLMTIICIVIFDIWRVLKYKVTKQIVFYCRVKYLNIFFKKYFSLKFAIYYYEFIQDDMDNIQILEILNEYMKNTDLKIVLYEMRTRLQEGESFEDILAHFDYLEDLFLSFFRMYIKNPRQMDVIKHYIDYSFLQLEHFTKKCIKYLVPSIYGFVAFFVISIYISIIIPLMNIFAEI